MSPIVLRQSVLTGLAGLTAARRSSSPFNAVFVRSTIGRFSSYVPDLTLIVVYAPWLAAGIPSGEPASNAFTIIPSRL